MANAQPEDDILIKRIKRLQEDRVDTQKEVCTKWVNSILAKENAEVQDLFADLADGVRLLKLLEILSGERLGRVNRGRQKLHHIDNVDRCMNFLRKKNIAVVGVSTEDFVAGNPRSILAVLRRIVLEQDKLTNTQKESVAAPGDDRSYQKLLLQWCRAKTTGYSGVNLTNFTSSWRNGMGFNALLHSHRPDLIDYKSLDASRPIQNLKNAFDTAERGLGIPKLLKPEDVNKPSPDENSIVTYIALLYQFFHDTDSVPKVETKKPALYRTEKVVSLQPTLSNGPVTRPKPALRSNSNRDSGISVDDGGSDRVDGYIFVQGDSNRPVSEENVSTTFEGSWECDYCTYANTPSTRICAMCFKPKTVKSPLMPVIDQMPQDVATISGSQDEENERTEPIDANNEEEGSESSLSSQETVVEIMASKEAAESEVELRKQIVVDSSLVDEVFERNSPSMVTHDGPTWKCPGCKHQNPETSRMCRLCFRTLRQLKSLSLEEMGIKDLAPRRAFSSVGSHLPEGPQ